MSKNKFCKSWICIVLIIILVAAVVVLSMLYGKNIFNLGKFPPEISACPSDAMQEGPSCTFTLEPIHYYVKKSGDNYLIYGPKINKIFEENNYSIAANTEISAESYSMVGATPFTSISLTYQPEDKEGKQNPAFLLSKETAEKVKGARFVTVTIPNTNVKIRFNTFYLPN